MVKKRLCGLVLWRREGERSDFPIPRLLFVWSLQAQAAKETAHNPQFQKLFHSILPKASIRADRNKKYKLLCTSIFYMFFIFYLNFSCQLWYTQAICCIYLSCGQPLTLTHWSISFIYRVAAVRPAAQAPQELLQWGVVKTAAWAQWEDMHDFQKERYRQNLNWFTFYF